MGAFDLLGDRLRDRWIGRFRRAGTGGRDAENTGGEHAVGMIGQGYTGGGAPRTPCVHPPYTAATQQLWSVFGDFFGDQIGHWDGKDGTNTRRAQNGGP